MVPNSPFERVVLNKEIMIVSEAIDKIELHFRRDHAEFTSFVDEARRRVVLQLHYMLAAGDRQQVETKTQALHADWKQMFKAKYFHRSRLGRWLLKKYPVRFIHLKHETVVITRVCPHVKLPHNNNRHVEFCVLKDNVR